MTDEDIDHDADDFGSIGEAFETSHDFSLGPVGEAEARLISQPAIVDFALDWMNAKR